MPRESNYRAIILKKQPFGEGDEIITFYTLEAGKIRGLAKSTRLAKSKLQYSLQMLFLANITVAGQTSLPKVIYANVVKSYAKLREHLEYLKLVYYSLELLMKFTADEQKNEPLFYLYERFFDFLESIPDPKATDAGFAKFKIELLEILGYGVHAEEHFRGNANLGFSNSKGGFGIRESVDLRPVSPELFEQFLTLRSLESFPKKDEPIPAVILSASLSQLQDLLSDFIKYHLERDVKSQRFLDMV